jgi:hypothetical protein
MLDFRKLFLVLAVLALSAGSAMAQLEPPLSCIAQAAGTPSIRDNGVTEMVGDVLIRCTGGRPRPQSELLPQVNIQIFTSPVINITSRLTGSAGGGNWTEALLFIDEPQPAAQTICGSTVAPESAPPGTVQAIITGVCAAHVGTGVFSSGGGAYLFNGLVYGTGQGAYAGTAGPGINVPSTVGIPGVPGSGFPNGTNCSSGAGCAPTARPNAFQARQAGPNSLIWQGIPVDPPGTSGERIFRITNVRVNASQLNNPRTLQSSVNLIISTSASGVINPIAMPITNPAPTVAIAQTPMDFSINDGPDTFLQCESQNFINASGSRFATTPEDSLTTPNTAGTQSTQFRLQYQERFPTVFRRRSVAQPSPVLTSEIVPPPGDNGFLGLPYQTESGHYRAVATSQWGLTGSAAGRGNITDPNSGAGVASSGTRLLARFNNLPQGARFWAAAHVNIFSLAGQITGQIRATVTDANGGTPYSPTNIGSTQTNAALVRYTGDFVAPNFRLVEIVPVGGTAFQTWEVLEADTTAFERVRIPFVVAYQSNTTNNLPTLGTARGSGHLAPLSTTPSASSTAPIPRFVEDPTNNNKDMFTINACVTNLLFPFVTNQGAFDTGLAIANTSKDPFGTALQTGACTVNFYGKVGNNKVCLSYPSPAITGGEYFTWTLSSGGAVTATAGFEGYVIAQCAFQYGHGYAFISDLGAQRLAQGYVALVMDAQWDGFPRTGSRSEVLGH